jgi:hypothetical protein
VDRRQITTRVLFSSLSILAGWLGGKVLDGAVSIPVVHDVGVVVIWVGVIGSVTLIAVNPWAKTAPASSTPTPSIISIPTEAERAAIESEIDDLHIDNSSGLDRIVLTQTEVPITIALADPPDDTAEPYLEWPHLVVRNDSSARLLSVRADLLITGRYGSSGTVTKLRWDPDDEGMVALEPRETRTIPLCIRSREQEKTFNTSRRGIAVSLTQWVCFVTDEGFLLNGSTGLRLQQGDSDLRARVTYGENGSAEAWFRAYVPRIEGKPMWVVALPASRGTQRP